ncbi:hypothetical protein D3C74_364680 [compost metagenome]
MVDVGDHGPAELTEQEALDRGVERRVVERRCGRAVRSCGGALVRAAVAALSVRAALSRPVARLGTVPSFGMVSPSAAEEPHGPTLPAPGADRPARGVAWRA